jgi:leucyl-tRNA synthetase
MPHLAEELWAMLGNTDLIASRAWPVADAALLADDTVTVAVQVNGKLRATLELAANLPEEEAKAAALAHPSVQSAIEGKTLRKTIVVPNRIVNLVAA